MSLSIPRRAVLAAALSLTLSCAVAAGAEDGVRAASDHFSRAVAGESSAIEPAAQAWQLQVAARPEDPLARAYLGAATTMRATTSWLPWRKIAHVEDGLAQIDKALALLAAAHDQARPGLAPVSLETRLVAANTFLALPAMFNRAARGQRLLEEMRAHPAFEGSPLSFRAQVWMAAGEEAARAGRKAEARKLLQQVVDAQGPQARRAGELIAGL